MTALFNLAVSNSISTSPAFTVLLTSTFTLETMPDNSLPMLTLLTGSNVPVAVTVTVRSPRTGACVT